MEGKAIFLCVVGERDCYVARDKTNERQKVSVGRPRHKTNFVGDREASDSEENCAFAFTVSGNQKETCDSTSCKEPAVEVSVDAITKKYF